MSNQNTLQAGKVFFGMVEFRVLFRFLNTWLINHAFCLGRGRLNQWQQRPIAMFFHVRFGNEF